jgi:DNA-binding ferritin-like protein
MMKRRKTASKPHTRKTHRPEKCKHIKRTLITTFMEMLTMIKVYHWNTHSFAEHKATDEIHSRLSENVDKFVEVLLGKDESRLTHLNEKIHLIRSKTATDFKKCIYEYRECMIGLSDCFDAQKDSDLLNIRDEILGDLNQLLYLFTLH